MCNLLFNIHYMSQNSQQNGLSHQLHQILEIWLPEDFSFSHNHAYLNF